MSGFNLGLRALLKPTMSGFIARIRILLLKPRKERVRSRRKKPSEHGSMAPSAMNAKRRKSKKSPDDEDRISRLSNDLLVYILSFLSMYDAVRTGILSSRWRGIWTSIPNLHFCKPSRKKDEDFIKFLDRSLALHVGSDVRKFCLKLKLNKRYASHVDRWIGSAVTRNARELRLQFFWYDSSYAANIRVYTLPSWLFKYDKLVLLDLCLCKVEVPNRVCFSSLRVLSLTQIDLSNDLIKKLLPGCPLLEDLTIVDCESWDNVCISSSSNPRFMHLRIEWRIWFYGIEIQVPTLQTLKLFAVVSRHPFCIKEVPHLREASIKLGCKLAGDEYEYRFMDSLFKAIRHAETLIICNRCIQVSLMVFTIEFFFYFL